MIWVKLVPLKAWGALAVLVGVYVGVLYYGHRQKLAERKNWEDKLAAQSQQYETAKRQAESELTARQKEHNLELGIALAKTKTVVHTSIKEIPYVLPTNVVIKYPLPNGFVRAYNLSASNTALSAGDTMDENPSGVGIDTVSEIVIRNHGRFYDVVAALQHCRNNYDAVVAAHQAFAAGISSKAEAKP